MDETKFRSEYALSDNLLATEGQVFLTGTQALVRLPLMQKALDAARGLNTAGFISGYRGSPLGMVDHELWNAQAILDRNAIRFLPAINEELGATAVLGSQQVETDPQRTVDGIFAYWYGKGPGVDRAADALKHGNAYGSSPTGGVLIVAGDDHGCVSSSMPHQSDISFQAWSVPTVSPASVAEYLEFGLYGWALSRFSGTWVGMTALSEVVESGATVDLDETLARVAAWKTAQQIVELTGYRPPEDGLHYRIQDPPSPKIEVRLQHKLDAVCAFAAVNSIDRQVIVSPHATVGIVTCGKAHYDLIEVFRRLALSLDDLAAAGVRLYKVGLSFPIEKASMIDFARGLERVLVVEEKAPIVEGQMRELFYNAPQGVRPVITGKHDAHGRPQISSIGELRPSRLIETVAAWLAQHSPALDRRKHVDDFTQPKLLSNASDNIRRVPYFCSGCPHNTSTRVPKGSRAQAGIGCHFMASWMNRDTSGQIQMGGEGADWAAHGKFTRTPHIFQNLGDGTYYHSGYLAIRQAVAARSNITYKILYNEAVAMTGGQPVDGALSVDAIARQVEAEGVKAVAVISDDIGKYDAIKSRFPAYTTFHDREELDQVQRRLREVDGVTVLIYQQTCAAVKRRRRKKGEMDDPPRRLFINQAVCEGCGDCGVQSNCLSIMPVDTEFGRKRIINQSSCNKDYTCAKGFCPSFVVVHGGALRKGAGALLNGGDDEGGKRALAARVARIPMPAPHAWTGPYDLLVTGVGGTGIITVGALLAVAAHLERKYSSVLDFMGFAQKGGAVLSFVRFAERREDLNQVRIDTQQADAFLACDLVVGASNDALQTVRHGRTRIVASIHEVPIPESLRNPDADLHVDDLLEKMMFAAGRDFVDTFDAQDLAEQFLGDTIGANILAMGYAWQRGLIPLELRSIMRAIELNHVAIDMNKLAFNLGRLAAADPQALADLHRTPAAKAAMPVNELIAHRSAHLLAYQDDAYAQRYRRLVERVRGAEEALRGTGKILPLTERVASAFAKLMAYKDEYEVARLYSDDAFRRQLDAQFEGGYTLEFQIAPPLFAYLGRKGEAPRKMRCGAWMLNAMRLLAKGRRLRGTRFDIFGKTAERRMERELIERYESRLLELLPQLTPDNIGAAVEIAAIPERIRGFGHVKIGNIALAREREMELLHRFDPERYPKPAMSKAAGAAGAEKVMWMAKSRETA